MSSFLLLSIVEPDDISPKFSNFNSLLSLSDNCGAFVVSNFIASLFSVESFLSTTEDDILRLLLSVLFIESSLEVSLDSVCFLEIISCSVTSTFCSSVSSIYTFNISSIGILFLIVSKIDSLTKSSNSLLFFCICKGNMSFSNKYMFVYNFLATLI